MAPDTPDNLPDTPKPRSDSFFGWLGRQIGHVRKAVKTDVGEKKLYENKSVEVAPHPQQPNITLRRTVIDEVIENKK